MSGRARSILAAAVAVAVTAVPPAGAATPAQKAYAAGLRAYVEGYAPIDNLLSQASFPVNTLVGIDATTTPANRLIVLPNVDTAYTVGRLDVRAQPLVIHVPAIPGRYYVMELLDAYTNVFGYIGTRTTGIAAGDYAVVGPAFHGALPAGVRAIHSPTPDVLVLGRTLVDGPADLPAVGVILGQYMLSPLSVFVAGGAPKPTVVLAGSPKRSPPVLPVGLRFFDELGRVLAADPPTAAERRALAPLRAYGIGPGIQTSKVALPAAVRAALARAVHDGPAHVQALADTRRRRSQASSAGWAQLGPKTGNSGTDFDLRAAVARVGLWANTPAEAAYDNADRDRDGRPLSGAHRYRLTFADPPPVKGFWSLTMYDRALFLYENPLRRYALGDRSATLRHGAGGSVTLYLQHARPAGHEDNWLPAPAGRFAITLRLYVPGSQILSGAWRPPGIVCVDCHP